MDRPYPCEGIERHIHHSTTGLQKAGVVRVGTAR